MYDIYLLLGSHRRPDFSIVADNPVLQKALRDHFLSRQLEAGFLGLNLSGDTAAEFLEQLIQAGGYGYVVPAAYRQPKVTLEMARAIAEKALQKEQKRRFPSVRFERVEFLAEDALWWKFGAPSPEWIEGGVVPGVLHFLVDKRDGHLWSAQEEVICSAHGEEYFLQCATTLSSQQVLDLLAEQLGLEWGTDYRHQNEACLKGAALVVLASEHTHPDFFESHPSTSSGTTFALRPTIQIDFRIIPYKSGYQSAPLLLLRGVMTVLSCSPAGPNTEAILFRDNGTLATLLSFRAGKLIPGQEWSSWAQSRGLSPSPIPFFIPFHQRKDQFNGHPALAGQLLNKSQPQVAPTSQHLATVLSPLAAD